MSERMNLRRRLIADLRVMGLSTDCELVLRPYSKTMWGYYDPNTDKLIVYMYSDRKCKALIQYSIKFNVVHYSCKSFPIRRFPLQRVNKFM